MWRLCSAQRGNRGAESSLDEVGTVRCCWQRQSQYVDGADRHSRRFLFSYYATINERKHGKVTGASHNMDPGVHADTDADALMQRLSCRRVSRKGHGALCMWEREREKRGRYLKKMCVLLLWSTPADKRAHTPTHHAHSYRNWSKLHFFENKTPAHTVSVYVRSSLIIPRPVKENKAEQPTLRSITVTINCSHSLSPCLCSETAP